MRRRSWTFSADCQVIIFFIVFPVICCCCSYYFNGILFYRISTKKPQIQPINVAFVGSFLVPFVATIFVAILYAIHAVFIGNKGLRKTPRWADDRETILRDLTNAAGVSLLVIIILFVDAMLFFTKTTITR